MTTGRKLRLGAFYLTAIATLVLAGLMLGEFLAMAFTGWVTDFGTHQVHDLTVFPLLWIALVVPMVLMLYRPASRVNTILAPVLFLVPLAAFAVLASSPIVMLPLVFGTLSLVALALHPAGRSTFRFDRVAHVNRALAALVVVAAVPLLVYAGGEFVRQLTLADEHVLIAHYGVMAIASVYIVVMSALAVVRARDFRFAAWSAGLVAIVVGAASILFTAESSVGPIWGTLAICWALAFVAGVEYVRRRESTIDGAVVGPNAA